MTTCARTHALVGQGSGCLGLCTCAYSMCVCGAVGGYIGQMSEVHLPAEIPGKMSKSAAAQSLRSIVELEESSGRSVYLRRSDSSGSVTALYFPSKFALKHFPQATGRKWHPRFMQPYENPSSRHDMRLNSRAGIPILEPFECSWDDSGSLRVSS